MNHENSFARHVLPSAARVEAFSDGVLAIAITLLVLQLRAPVEPGEFLTRLSSEWRSYVAYLATFLMIGTLWLTHHALFARVARVDGMLLAANLGVLFFASLLPFPTAVISSAFRDGQQSDEAVAVVFYAVMSMALSVAFHALAAHLERSPALLHRPQDAAVIRRNRGRALFALLPPLLGIAVAFVLPLAALVLQIVTPWLYVLSIAGSPAHGNQAVGSAGEGHTSAAPDLRP